MLLPLLILFFFVMVLWSFLGPSTLGIGVLLEVHHVSVASLVAMYIAAGQQ